MLVEFQAAHPRIELDVRYDDRPVDLVAERFDVALRIGPLSSPDLVVARLARLGRALVATPQYLEVHGTPRRPAELSRHNFIRFSTIAQGAELTLRRDGQELRHTMTSRLLVNNTSAVRDLALRGYGIALVPRWLVAAELAAGTLREVLADWDVGAVLLHAVYPSATLKTRRVTALVDHVGRSLRRIPGVEPS